MWVGRVAWELGHERTKEHGSFNYSNCTLFLENKKNHVIIYCSYFKKEVCPLLPVAFCGARLGSDHFTDSEQ